MRKRGGRARVGEAVRLARGPAGWGWGREVGRRQEVGQVGQGRAARMLGRGMAGWGSLASALGPVLEGGDARVRPARPAAGSATSAADMAVPRAEEEGEEVADQEDQTGLRAAARRHLTTTQASTAAGSVYRRAGDRTGEQGREVRAPAAVGQVGIPADHQAARGRRAAAGTCVVLVQAVLQGLARRRSLVAPRRWGQDRGRWCMLSLVGAREAGDGRGGMAAWATMRSATSRRWTRRRRRWKRGWHILAERGRRSRAACRGESPGRALVSNVRESSQARLTGQLAHQWLTTSSRTRPPGSTSLLFRTPISLVGTTKAIGGLRGYSCGIQMLIGIWYVAPR